MKGSGRGLVMVLGLICLACEPCAGLAPEEPFARANSLYAQEDYAGALALYGEILEAGWEAPELYYNASNCYLRTGKVGLALVMCRRAQRLAPADDDIRANLAFIKSLVEEGQAGPEESRLLSLLLALHRRLSIDGAARAASVAAFVLAGLLSLRIIYSGRPRLVGYCCVAAALMLALALGGLGAKLWEERTRTEAVVVVPLADVYSGPGEDFVVQTSLGEGAEVRVRRTGKQWTEVSLGPELAGWVRSSDVEII